MKEKKPNIIDVTLREASYKNGFNFSPQFVSKYLQEADDVGLKYCEIGHGLGLGAYRVKKFRSKISDKDLIDKVNSLKLNTKVGMFIQPKFNNYSDLEILEDSKLKFLRLGVIPENYKDLNWIIEFFSKKKKEIFIFFMQFNKDEPKDLKVKIKSIYEKHGLINFYFADSTGSLTFDRIKSYYDSVKSINKKLVLGFHGHNNLGLANYNSIQCQEYGFNFIDASLSGAGREAGNATLEHLLIFFQKKMKLSKKKLVKLLNLSMHFDKITNLSKNNVSLYALYGLLQVHSGNKKDFVFKDKIKIDNF